MQPKRTFLITGRLYSNASDVLGAYVYKDAAIEVGAALQ